ncbi:MAG: hypothetical protein OEV91_05410 [Desulfobulbaceae bacterium]|nr:hypothetical protein [Desulfobulbaceae bacterium]
MRYALLILAGLAILIHGTTAQAAPKTWSQQEMTIYFSNDVHGEVEPCG